MTELEPRREFENQEPFVIRAHHLPIFRYLLQRSRYWGLLYSLDHVFSPKELAEQLGLVNKYHKSEHLRNLGIEYSIDVLGTSRETSNKYQEQSQKTFETFLSLPDNHPVEITEGIPDDICKVCAIGAHCRLKGEFEGDRRYLDPFVKAIDYIYSRKPFVTMEKVYFLDAEKPQEVRRVRTTMGIVKNVLATRPFELSDTFWENLKLLWNL